MDNNKIDRLFRERLDQAEYTPKAESWEAVKAEIGQSPNSGWAPFMKIAAAVIVILTATWLVISLQDQPAQGPMISNVDHPVPIGQYDWEWEKIQVDETPVIDKLVPSKTQGMLAERASEQIFEKTELPILNLDQIGNASIAVATSKPTLMLKSNLQETEQPNIKITYIAKQATDSTKTNVFNGLISLAKETQPIELLADLRDAKNSLFNRN